MTRVARSERHRVWIALSDLFLDTDVSIHFDYIEQELAASSFSDTKLDLILRDEVAPVCLPNLHEIAGEWAGFQPEYLVRSIEAYLKRPAWLRRMGQRRRARQLGQLVPEWPEVLDRIRIRRAG